MTYPYRIVSQLTELHPGSGWADCWEASLGTVCEAFGKVDPSTSDEAIVNAMSLASRGTPDSPNNAYTTLGQADVGLQHYGFPADLSYDWTKILADPWSILLVDGTAITLADGTKPYSASWFNYETGPDHFVVFGPAWQGSYSWVANPLDPAKAWRLYDLGSLQRATTCGYLLGDIPAKPAPKPLHWTAKTKATLKPQPNHESTGICPIPAGASGVTWGETKQVGADLWLRCQFRASYGWLIKDNLTIAAA